MSQFLYSGRERIYVQSESTYGTILNSSGTATVAGGDYLKHNNLVLTPAPELTPRPEKTGILSAIPPVVTFREASWSLRIPMSGSGTAGTAPDCDPLLKALFGQAVSISAGVSATYALADACPSVTIWSFLTDSSSAIQRALAGAIVEQAEFSFGQSYAELTLSGPAKWVVDSKSFSSLVTAMKCGLTAFPAEPGSPTSAGTPASGFAGSLAIGSYSPVPLLSGRVTYRMNRELRRIFGNKLPGVPVQGIRAISWEAEVYLDDSSDAGTLLTAANLSTAVATTTLVNGDTAGNIWTHTFKNQVIQAPGLNDSGRSWTARISGATNSSDGATADEATLVLT